MKGIGHILGALLGGVGVASVALLCLKFVAGSAGGDGWRRKAELRHPPGPVEVAPRYPAVRPRPLAGPVAAQRHATTRPHAKFRHRVSAGTRASSPAPASVAATSSGGAGLKVAIDPETGRLVRPSPQQTVQHGTEALGRRSSEGLQVIRLPDGTRMVHLDDRFMEYAVARIDSAGRLETGCVRKEGLARVLHTQGSVPAARPVE